MVLVTVTVFAAVKLAVTPVVPLVKLKLNEGLEIPAWSDATKVTVEPTAGAELGEIATLIFPATPPLVVELVVEELIVQEVEAFVLVSTTEITDDVAVKELG